MTAKDRESRSDKLSALIKDLAKSQEVLSGNKRLNDYYTKLRGIYLTKTTENFKHLRNDIFSVITEVHTSEPGAIDVLGENMRVLYVYTMSKPDEKLKASVSELFDDVSLDISRIKYIYAIDRRMAITGNDLFSQIDTANQKIEEAQKKYDSIKDDVDKTSKKISNAYSEFVSILGIFSAIVLVFFGGTSILGNVFSMVNEVDLPILIIAGSFIGIVVFDLLFMFIYFLAKILDRSIAATDRVMWWESLLNRFKTRYPIVFYANIAGVVVTYITIAVWMTEELFVNRIEVCETVGEVLAINLNMPPILYYLGVIIVVYNLSFTVAYILSRITDINIGRIIELKERYFYRYEKEENLTVIVRDYDYSNTKELKIGWFAPVYCFVRNTCSIVYSGTYNAIKRILCRYPYHIIINIILVAIFAGYIYLELKKV